MNREWTSNLGTDEEKDKFLRVLANSKPVLERLSQILRQREKSLDHVELSVKSFDNPSWAYKQAFNNGFRSSLNITQDYIKT